MRSILVLEDGSVYEGLSYGAIGTAVGEVVFNTGMTGYQEILTDPSYAGQIVTLTYPLIGNYGINPEDIESRALQPKALVVHQACAVPSNWRMSISLNDYLKEFGMLGLHGIDTRTLTRNIRHAGVMMGVVTNELTTAEALAQLKAAPKYDDNNYVKQVTTPEPYVWDVDGMKPAIAPALPGTKYRLTMIDCGLKYNILRRFASFGSRITVMPCTCTAEDVMRTNPDGILLSPGPGDPALLGDIVALVKKLSTQKPMFGICLGNQMVGCAFGGHTFKLKFGHRGANHPVHDLFSDKVRITSQNHGYALDPDGLGDGMQVWQQNLNDGTVEGLRHCELPIMTIQYHPEASPGPRDSDPYFSEFLTLVDQHKSAK